MDHVARRRLADPREQPAPQLAPWASAALGMIECGESPATAAEAILLVGAKRELYQAALPPSDRRWTRMIALRFAVHLCTIGGPRKEALPATRLRYPRHPLDK